MNHKRKGEIVTEKQKSDQGLAIVGIGSLSLKESTASTSQDDATLAVASINKLNDDCLREIFSHLSKRQLIAIERVCKRWKEVALNLWSSETSLTSEKILDIIYDFSSGFHILHFKSVLIRCEKYLVSLGLNLSDLFYPLKNSVAADAVIYLVCIHCKNLKHLNVSGGELVTKKGLNFLEKRLACMPNLESFTITNCGALDDKFIESFVNKTPNLRSLCINGNFYLTGDGLVNTGHAFKKLEISSCDGISVETLEKILDNSPSLEVFKGSDKCTLSMLNERPLREHLVKLQSYSSDLFEGISESKKFLPFPNLLVLELKGGTSTNNEVLSKFYEWFPNLESLDLFENSRDEEVFNNDVIKKLVKLPKLKSLNLSSLKWLTGDALVYLAANTDGRIEVMECASCHELYDSEMVKFVSLCPTLKYLDVSCCKNISGKFLKGVLDSMHLRTSRKPLKIRITYSEICDGNQYEKQNPLLVLEKFGYLQRDYHYHYDDDFCSYENGSYFTSSEDDDYNCYEDTDQSADF